MDSRNVEVTYELTFQKETDERSIQLLLAEMTSGIQYYADANEIKMDAIKNNISFVDPSIEGEIIAKKQIADDGYLITYCIPETNLDPELGGIANLWAVVAGEVFNFHFIKRSKLVDLLLPDSFMEYYYGPRFGIKGIRNLLGVEQGPIFGSIIKPNIGIDPKKTSEVAAILFNAGFNFVKDDEICINPNICLLEKRIESVSRIVREYREKNGRNIIFAANVTTDFSTMGKAAELAIKKGANGLMVDPFCTGLSAIDFLRRNFDVPIYVHRVGYGLHCLGEKYSIDFGVFSKIFRLLGADFSHVGGIWGKSDKSYDGVRKLLDILKENSSIKETWPVVTGISLDNMNEYYNFYGPDTMYMDHIDIYSDIDTSKKKLQSLKEKMNG